MVTHSLDFAGIFARNKNLWEHYHDDASQRGDLVLQILSHVKNLPASRILDVGCGNGVIASRLARCCVAVKAIDKNANPLPASKKNLQFECTEAEKLDESPATYDAVIMCDVLEHLSQPALVLQKLNSFLKKDGVMYISTPNKFSPLNILSDPHYSLPGFALLSRPRIQKIIRDYLHWTDHSKTDYPQLFSYGQLVQLLEKSGFSWCFINTEVLAFALDSPQAVWNRSWHLNVIQIIKKLHLHDIFGKLANDQPLIFNRWLNPTWYILAQKANQ